jgi:hypothetical protein
MILFHTAYCSYTTMKSCDGLWRGFLSHVLHPRSSHGIGSTSGMITYCGKLGPKNTRHTTLSLRKSTHVISVGLVCTYI